jgi:protein-S-isoprenylcysteine O-methyltransferase Ste14
MLDCKVVLPIVGKSLVETGILVLGDILRLAHPDWLDLVKDFVFMSYFLNLLGLLVLLGNLVLNLGLFGIFFVIVFLFSVIVRISDFLFG